MKQKRLGTALCRLALAWSCVAVCGSVSVFAQTDDASRGVVDQELRFASALVDQGFPDYAQKALDRLVTRYPEAKALTSSVRIKISTSRGNFEEAERLMATMPVDSPETTVMKLALADSYYAWDKLTKAREIYDAFFKQYPKGPPPNMERFYAESAYKYAQMLLLKGDRKAALQAYGYVLVGSGDENVKRHVQTEIAELLLKLGQTATGEEQKKYFADCREVCNKIQWGDKDLYFGRSVTILAHMSLIQGDKAGAEKTLDEYLPMLKEIDDYLRNNDLPLKLSPMAECRYLLGSLNEEQGRAMYADKARKQEAVKTMAMALQHYYTVFVKYPASSWAPEAGRRADALKTFLEAGGHTVKMPKIDMGPLIAAQFKEAKALFGDGSYEDAIAKYREVLNLVPEYPGSPTALGELAQCYVQRQDPLYANVVTRYLAERFSRKEALREEAGTALIGVADALEKAGQLGPASEITRLFLARFPSHSRVPAMWFKTAETREREERFAEAVNGYREIVEKYPKAQVYPLAMSRLALCYTRLGDHSNAVAVLTRYTAELSPGAERAAATFRLAEEYRASDQMVQALNEYARVVKYLTDESAVYSPTSDDVARNRTILELAMYFKPYCYSRLHKPENMVATYQDKSVEGFEAFLKAFPKSEWAPAALSIMGTILYVQNKPDAANAAYERIKRDFPDSEQAKNVLFARGDSLVKLGRTDEAVKVFGEMFTKPDAFTPAQFLRVGQILAEAGQPETALRAYEAAVKAEERGVWEAAQMGLAEIYMAQSNLVEAAKAADVLLTKYPTSGYLVRANFVLSRANAGLAQQNPAAASDHFDKAIRAMNQIRRYATEPEVKARADLETAHIQLLMGAKADALATYDRLVMLGPAQAPKARGAIDTAFVEAVAMMQEQQAWQDILDTCEAYLQRMPGGAHEAQAREWRNEAILKGAKSSGAFELNGGAAPARGSDENASAVVPAAEAQ